jgi:GTP cyclohydrolase IA
MYDHMDLQTDTRFELIEGRELGLEEYPAGPAGSAAADGAVASLIRALLHELGEEPEREGLLRTPERVARMFGEVLAGYRQDPVALVNGAIFSTDYRGLVLVRDVEFYSLCEHHLLPFYGRAHVAYLAEGRVLGLSKIPRIVDMFARRLQIQEGLTQQIGDFLWEVLQPRGVAVVVEAAHMCAMMRGVEKSGVRMVTSAMRGAFEEDAALRQELYSQLGQARL